MSIIKDLFTENDGATHCPVRWLGLGGAASGVGLAIFDVVVQHAHFDLQGYGIGLAATIAAVGKALQWKPDTGAPAP